MTPDASGTGATKSAQQDVPIHRCRLQVGYVETIEQSERKSGAGAWSLRAHNVVMELAFAGFRAKFGSGNVPFHRIAYFKQGSTIVWYVPATGGAPDTGRRNCITADLFTEKLLCMPVVLLLWKCLFP